MFSERQLRMISGMSMEALIRFLGDFGVHDETTNMQIDELRDRLVHLLWSSCFEPVAKIYSFVQGGYVDGKQ
jgi:hypothetical protein